MAGNLLLNMLLECHIQQTKLEPPPFYFETDFDPDCLDTQKYLLISNSDEDMDKFINNCMLEFNTDNPDILFGSVHLNPQIWTNFALRTIINSYKLKQNKIKFPNGCCSQGESCPINKYYLVVLKNLTLKK